MARQGAKTEAQIDQELDGADKPKRDEPKKLSAKRGADGLYFVEYSAGGEVPDVLKGRWTNINKVNAAIALYNAAKE